MIAPLASPAALPAGLPAVRPTTLPAASVGSAIRPAPAGGAISFAEALASVAAKGLNSLAQAEAVAAQGLTGEASARQVADAVMSAERSLQSAVAVRDKITAAWLEISRMQI